MANWLDSLNSALDEIEKDLTGELDISKAARRAGVTAVQFSRIFGYLAGVSLSEYVRRRRLSLAADDLSVGGDRVLEVSLRYGYQSPTSFTRAFKEQHGISPAEARRPGATLTAYPRMQFQMTIQGVTQMNYRIVNMPAFRIVGMNREFSMVDDQQLKEIPGYWCELTEERCAALVGIADGPIPDILGVCKVTSETTMDYWIGVTSTKTLAGYNDLNVPAATWAVFASVGKMPEALQAVTKRIFGEWLPTSGYQLASGVPDLEVYPLGDMNSDGYTCEVWVPLVKS